MASAADQADGAERKGQRKRLVGELRVEPDELRRQRVDRDGQTPGPGTRGQMLDRIAEDEHQHQPGHQDQDRRCRHDGQPELVQDHRSDLEAGVPRTDLQYGVRLEQPV